MKTKIIAVSTSIITLVSALSAQAEKIGDIVGTVYNTDIVAYINNYAVPSYAANGTSVIVAEDLRNFGFDVVWNNGTRSLTIARNSETSAGEITVSKTQPPGSKFSDLLYTDISVYANGVKIPSYAINGYTMIPIESLSVLGEVNWVQDERAIKLWVDGLHIRSEKQPVKQFTSTGVILNDGSGERPVDISFTIENHTGMYFPVMLLAPMDVPVVDAPDVLDENGFANGMSLDLTPREMNITSTNFYIIPVDENGAGYVFDNIDLAETSIIQLYLENGVPKAVIN